MSDEPQDKTDKTSDLLAAILGGCPFILCVTKDGKDYVDWNGSGASIRGQIDLLCECIERKVINVIQQDDDDD